MLNKHYSFRRTVETDMIRKDGSLRRGMRITACQVLESSVCLFPHLKRSSMSILDAPLPGRPTSVRTLSTNSEIEVPLSTGWGRWASVGKYGKRRQRPRNKTELYTPFLEHSSMSFYHLQDSFSLDIASNRFIAARKNDFVHPVKFFKLDWRGWVERYETDDSTWGGGRKSLMTLSTFAYSL